MMGSIIYCHGMKFGGVRDKKEKERVYCNVYHNIIIIRVRYMGRRRYRPTLVIIIIHVFRENLVVFSHLFLSSRGTRPRRLTTVVYIQLYSRYVFYIVLLTKTRIIGNKITIIIL